MQMSSNVRRAVAPCNLAMHTIVVQCSPDGELMNINISQCVRGLQLRGSYPGVLCDLANYYTPCSWSDLCWLTTLGEGNNGLEFPPFVHNLTVDWLSPNSLEMVLLHFPAC